MKHSRNWVFAGIFTIALIVFIAQNNRVGTALQTPLNSVSTFSDRSSVTLGRLASQIMSFRSSEPLDFREETSLQLEETLQRNNLVPDHHLRILTTELPAFYLKENKETMLQVAGGVRPYRFEITEGALPEGIQFDAGNGVFFGEVEEEMARLIVVRVTDESNASVEKEFLVMARERSGEAEGNFVLRPLLFPKAIVGKYYHQTLPVFGGQKPYQFKINGELPPGFQFQEKEGIVFGQPLSEGNYSFDVEVRDAEGSSLGATYQIEISDSPLYLTSSRLEEGWVGMFYHMSLEALGGKPGYSWSLGSGELPKGLTFYPKTGVISGVPLKAANTKLVLSVTDANQGFDSVELILAIHESSLEMTQKELPAGTIGKFYYARLSAKGGEPPYEWAMEGKLPKGLSFQKSTGVILGTPKIAGDEILKITITDQAGTKASGSFLLKISEKPLTLNLISQLVLSVGEFYFFSLESEGGTPDYVWQSTSDLPEGLVLFPSGVLVGTPVKAGQALLHIQVRDQAGEVVEGNMVIQVLSETLTIQTNFLQEATFNEFYYTQFAAKGGNFPYRWSVGNEPNGLFLNMDSGVFSGTPSQAGDFFLVIQVRDHLNHSASVRIPFVVIASSLKILTTGLSEGTVGMAYQSVIEVDGGKPPYLWNMVTGGLPSGLRLDSSTGVISGTPVEGAHTNIGIQVTDQLNSRIQKTFELNIAGEELRIINETLPEGTISEPYSQTLNGEGGIPPYRWFLESGSLPANLAISGTGIISGVPNVSGSFPIRIRLEDAARDSVLKPLQLQILNRSLTFETEELQTPRVEEAYHAALEGSGGETPYTWSLVNGNLPDGLELSASGIISGTPTQAFQEETFTIQLTDHRGTHVERNFTLSVRGGPPAPVNQLVWGVGDAKVGFAWRIPNDPAITEVRIFRGINAWPEIETAAPVYVGMDDQFLDTNLSNGETYYYVVLTFNPDGEPSEITADLQISVTPNQVTLNGPYDPFADSVVSFEPLSSNAFGASFLPNNILGAPSGLGAQTPQSLPSQLVSLNARTNNNNGATPPYGGAITLSFDNNMVVNGPGFDFTVFENAFFLGGDPNNRFMEPAVLSVSQNGIDYYDIPFDYVPHYNGEGIEVMSNPFSYASGFAGIEPVLSSGGFPDPTNPNVSGGDHFDLSHITVKNLLWVKYIRIRSTGDLWLTDMNGNLVRHTSGAAALSGVGNSGFDLDAVSAIHD